MADRVSLRPCWVCRQPVPEGRCPAHPRGVGIRPDYHRRNRRYGRRHRNIRTALLANHLPGNPCALCGNPMRDPPHLLDLAHADHGGYLGLAHQACNRDTSDARRQTP